MPEAQKAAAPAGAVHYEFGGPIGALGVIIGLPVVIYALFFLCNSEVCLSSSWFFEITGAGTGAAASAVSSQLTDAFSDVPEQRTALSIVEFFRAYFIALLSVHEWVSYEGWMMYLGWMAFNVFLERVLPGESVDGVPLPLPSKTSSISTGIEEKEKPGNNASKRLKYTLSGHLQFWICILAMGHAYPIIRSYIPSPVDTTQTSSLPPAAIFQTAANNWISQIANSVFSALSTLGFGEPLENLCQQWISTTNPASAATTTAAAAGDTGICVVDMWQRVFVVQGFMPLPLQLIYDHYVPLITASIAFSFALSIYLYLSSFYPRGKLLAKGGNTGNPIYDFFIGRELNPRIGSLDLKEFCELRPGLIGWLVINLGMATKQYMKRRAGSATGQGSISLSMLLITLLQGIYVWDALYMERAILTTMDITTDGFGFMLAFGDLAWVPFIYSLQARYLVDYDPELTLLQVSGILALQCLGYYIFRSANSEKDAFRRDPNSAAVKHLRYLQTKRGTRLLTSGWWGSARKINYTGDWLITLSWCLLCGFGSPIPYFQALYFLVLLIHRAIRDDQMCHEKYGDDWLEYKRQVPYVFIPYVI